VFLGRPRQCNFSGSVGKAVPCVGERIINLNGYTKVYSLIQDMTRMPIHGIMAGDLFGYHENLNQMLDAGDQSDNGHLCDDASPLKSV